jgi:hypothetical protein
LYVVDPAARSRGQTNAETVQQALVAALGDAGVGGQNDVQAGIGQLRARMEHGRFWVSRSAAVFVMRPMITRRRSRRRARTIRIWTSVKSNDHRLDALRYAVMERFWDPTRRRNGYRVLDLGGGS